MKLLSFLFLYPISLLYGAIVFVRNKCFDFKILSSKEFQIPVLSVGNITVGGTGKTPHVEYLLQLLSKSYQTAFLSRGYRRKTRGFLLAKAISTAQDIGDEPFQIKRKFPHLLVAVDGNRVRGIHRLMEASPDLEVIILDDAYQHRRVIPGINIVLFDFNRPVFKDNLLPYGRLREPVSEKKRADIIIFTKVPPAIPPLDIRLLGLQAEARPYQKVFFSSLAYKELLPVFDQTQTVPMVPVLDKESTVVLVCGIADPAPFVQKITDSCQQVIPFLFPDHHAFSRKELVMIEKAYHDIPSPQKIIITTEKDAACLMNFQTELSFTEAWYYFPISIEFLKNDVEIFNQHILHYMKNNGKNSILFE